MPTDDLWIPDHADGSGWAEVDWPSVAHGSRYHYRHGENLETARSTRPRFYRVVTRLESDAIVVPHENTYFVAADALSDFVAEFVWNDGAEIVWHIEPCDDPPPEADVLQPVGKT